MHSDRWVGHKDVKTTMAVYAMVKEKEAKMNISDNLGITRDGNINSKNNDN